MALILAGCGGAQEPAPEAVADFFGGIVADEPLAARVGEQVLVRGGSAADAAVAATFALTVTYPAAAGLGGGGVCLFHDAEKRETEAIEFPARAPAAAGARDMRAAVPGLVRGMAVLHARHGRSAWADLLLPAERLARDGHAVTRALANELAAVAQPLFADAEAMRIYGRADGRPLGEGEALRQPELADTLSRLRRGGAGELYLGPLAAEFAAGVAAAGGTLTADDLRGYAAQLRPPLERRYGVNVLSFSGPATAELWALLAGPLSWAGASAEAQPHLFAEAAALVQDEPAAARDEQALRQLAGRVDRGRHTPRRATERAPAPPSATGFVVADEYGQAVACALTMNRPFGTGRVARGTGIVIAAAPDAAGAGADALGVVLLTNKTTGSLFFGAAASGGTTAAPALVRVALETLAERRSLAAAMRVPRLVPAPAGDLLWIEPELPAAQRAALEARGHRLVPTGALGRVVAFFCPIGLPRRSSCEFVADPRGFGLGITAR